MTQYDRIVERMVSYPRGGFVTCGNILQLIDAAAAKIVGGDLEKVLIVTNHPDVYSLKYPNASDPLNTSRASQRSFP
ncbi:hypothetical protein [Epizootic haematopoietic necrosis virus]|uniref:Uncharacterized protein n=1 Tax=Epizootic haematopoietic necrosis virus TaxID=100217 RepID=A0A7G9TLI7_9VIRU|nr:hypothetical protein [Epizootic haematopoietic necrosis virus]